MPENTIHVGDTISVTLVGIRQRPAGAGGLCHRSRSRGWSGPSRPPCRIRPSIKAATIIIPFAGEIRAAGRTTHGKCRTAIIAALRGKANETQALVQIVQTTDNSVTVTGDVNRPGRIALTTSMAHGCSTCHFGGRRFDSGKARDMLVQLSRGGVCAQQ